MNDTQATQVQVTDTLRDMAEGILPLAVVTVGCLLLSAVVGDSNG